MTAHTLTACPHRFAIAFAFSICCLSTHAATAVPNDNQTAANTTNNVALVSGQRLTIAQPIGIKTPEGAAAQQMYFETALAEAMSAGLSSIGFLYPIKNLTDAPTPDAFALYTWPTKQAQQAFDYNAKRTQRLQLRTQAWSQLMINNITIAQDAEINFDPKKTYTLLTAWVKNQQSYDIYLANTAKLRQELGTKIVLKLKGDEYESLDPTDTRAPDFIILAEWNSTEDVTRYTTDPVFQANQHYFTDAMDHFEFFTVFYTPQPLQAPPASSATH